MSAPRTFTLEDAQALLPVLEQLLRAAMEARRRVEEVDQEMQNLVARILVCGGLQLDPIRNARRGAERERAAQQLKDAVAEIAASGAQVKDIEMGLLDFPCRMKGKSILLCWKLGEPTIAHWHGAKEGFANRKPLDPRLFESGSRLIN